MKYIKLLATRNAFVYNSYYMLTSVRSPYEFYIIVWKLGRKVYIYTYKVLFIHPYYQNIFDNEMNSIYYLLQWITTTAKTYRN